MEPPKELHELAVGMSLLELTEDMASVAGEITLLDEETDGLCAALERMEKE